jgi:hypothetical protein
MTIGSLATHSQAANLSCADVDGMSIFGYKYGEYIYIGSISNEYGSNSIGNEYGWGNEYKSNSIMNEYGNFGSAYSSNSAFNEYASNPPIIINNNFKFIGYLTTNDYLYPSINTYIAIGCAKNSYASANRSQEDITFANKPASAIAYTPPPTPTTCPANSSLINGQCFCNAGYQNNSSLTSCDLATTAPSTLLPAPNTTISSKQKGVNIKTSDGTIYMTTTDGKRRPYTSAGAFLSYGFNSFSGVIDADAADLALPISNFIPPRDGKIICSDRGTDKGTCYLITDSKKAGFTSATVFKALGFDFKNSSAGDVSWMESTTNIDNASAPHRKGVLINNNGTVLLVSVSSVLGIPDMATFQSWGYTFDDVVPANDTDKTLPQREVLRSRSAGELMP